jgi:hypothetical protein
MTDDLSTTSELIHWCDLFRDLERVMTPDPRYLSRSVLDPTVGARQMTMEDHWQDIATIDLHEGVPWSVRVHFDTARNLLLHSWYVYRFHPVAEMHAFSSAEYALNRRAGTPPHQIGPGFKMLLARAVEEGWIRDDRFRHYGEIAARRAEAIRQESDLLGTEEPASPELRPYVETLIEALPFLRNELAHGSAHLSTSGKRTLALCCDLINQLFPAA